MTEVPSASRLERTLRDGELAEIVWSHVQDGGVIWMPFGPKKLAFEVGRRGSYGLHSFDSLVRLGRERPSDVARALEEALASAP